MSNHQISSGGSSLLSGVLSDAPGVFIKDYGGVSALKTISQRGLGAEHTLILINGIRVSSFQNGLVDLGLYPVEEIESVEVLHGGFSAAHGSEAIGGVVNVLTRSQTAGSSAAMETGLGSFGYQRVRFSGGVGQPSGGVRVSLTDEKGREDYPFIFRNGPSAQTLNRSNADFRTRHGTVDSFVEIDDATRVKLFARVYRSSRGAPGPVVSADAAGNARQQDENDLIQGSVERAVGSDGRLLFTTQVQKAYQRYTDPDLRIGNAEGLDTYFRNTDYRSASSLEFGLDQRYDVTVGGEAAVTVADGTSLLERISRWHGASYIAGRYSPVSESPVFDEISLFPAIRIDAFSGSSPAWSPSLGALLRFADIDLPGGRSVSTSLRSTVNRNFRIPTFNELYYSGGGGFGNPSLRPEFSTGFDVGASLTLPVLGLHVIDATYFHNWMDDRIIWVPAGGLAVTPMNIRRVEASGWEAAWTWHALSRLVVLKFNYSAIRSLKKSKESPGDTAVNTQLIYIPAETANLALSTLLPVDLSALSSIEGRISYRFVGLRYTTADNTGSLPAFDVVDVGLLLQWRVGSISLGTKLEVLNLLDADYQVIRGYPMPFRSIRASVAVGT